MFSELESEVHSSGFFEKVLKAVLGVPVAVVSAMRGLLPSQMWGRVYDLRGKRLVELDGYRLFVMPNDYIGRAILENRSYEPHVTRVIREHLRDDSVFLDIGANVGFFTLLASRLLTRGKVIAVEPNPQNLQLLYASIMENDAKNIRVHPYAASDSAGILKFTTVGSNGGVVTEYAKDQQFFLLVPSITLDELLEREDRIDLVKIDIEAHEPAAIRGMDALIRRFRPSIITEFHPWAMQLNSPDPPILYLQALCDLGYKLAIINNSGELLSVASPSDVLDHWAALGRETAHLDLFASPS